jgi:hypothetical protein
MAVWYSLWSFGIFFPICYVWTKKNLATLIVGLARGEGQRCTLRVIFFRASLGTDTFMTTMSKQNRVSIIIIRLIFYLVILGNCCLHYPIIQCCQMVCFQTKNPNLGKFCRENIGIFYDHGSILWPLKICYGHLVYFLVIW